MDLSHQIESEQRRLQERSQIAHLQGQVDDLRHRLEQQAARAQLATEQARQAQDMIGQLEARLLAQVEEFRQQAQVQLRAFQGVQKEIAELRLRVEEPARQVLSLMAQVQDVQDALRQLREELGAAKEGDQQLARQLEEERAKGVLREERLARLDSQIARLLAGEEERNLAVVRLREEVEAERQNLRRQMGELERLGVDLRAETQEFVSRLNRLAELQRQGSAALEGLREEIKAQLERLEPMAADMQRIEREAIERSLQEQERLEDLRLAVQRDWAELRQAAERREESERAWLARIEELYHSLDARFKRRDEEMHRLLVRLEERVDALEGWGEGLIRALLGVFQEQIEQGAQVQLQRTERAGDTDAPRST